MEEKEQLDDEMVEKVPGGIRVVPKINVSLTPEEKKDLIKTLKRIDRETILELPQEMLDKVSGGASYDDDDDPWQWYYMYLDCPYCGSPTYAFAPYGEYQYCFCPNCGFDDRHD